MIKRAPTTTPSLLRQINRSAVVDLVRREGPISASALVARLDLSPATVKRVVDSLVAEDLAIFDGFDDITRGRPSARVRFRGDRHAIIGIEASQDRLYGAVCDLNGTIQTELSVEVPDKDAERNVERLLAFIDRLLAAPRPPGQSIRGIGIGVPSIVRQPSGEVVLSLGLGWKNFPLLEVLRCRLKVPVFVENILNLSALGEWGFGKGRGAHCVVSLQVGPGGGGGIVIDGKLHHGRSYAAGELAWFLDDPMLTGREFKHLGDKQALRYGPFFPKHVFDALEEANRRFIGGTLTLSEVNADPGHAAVREIIEYTTLAVAAIAALLDPDVVILSGEISCGQEIVLAALADRLVDDIYDPPTLTFSELGHRNIMLGAIMQVLDSTTLNPA